jgi:sialate O-acetylesterase
MKISYKVLYLMLSLGFTGMAKADIHLSVLFQNNMVLQRDKPCPIWGTAAKSEKITLLFNNNTYKTSTGKDGKWKITLPAQPAGGPYQVTISGKNTIVLDNVLFGDVWICGGQSNMQFHVRELAQREADTSRDNNPGIRIFTAGITPDYVPQDTLIGGQWQVASVESIQNFSAVAFFFGRYVQEHIGVPIGLISDNLGATAVEEWMSNEAIHQFPQFDTYYNTYIAPGKSMNEMKADFEKQKPAWEKKYYLVNDPGLEQQWYKSDTDTSDWQTMNLPGYWEDKGLPDYDGSVWFRKTFDLPPGFKGGFHFGVGPADDYDIAWVNGVKVGETYGNFNLRGYSVPDSLLKPTGNVLVERVFDAGDKGGMYNMFWDPRWAGKWLYKPGVKINAANFKRPLVPNAYIFGSPTILYNGNIAPLTPLAIKGFIWYQGEGNAGRAEEYKSLFPAMIQDWRKHFNQGDLPFFIVQLANYNAEPGADWAALREAQASALALPNTGIATAIDIGDADNIHPKNKQDVGKRLGLAAMKVAYGKDTTHVSPVFTSMEKNGDSIIVHFDDLVLTKDKYGYVHGFSIAGSDSVFHWAKAYIRNDNAVVVYSDQVKAPIAVRYAWANNPEELDLYNKEGLPALPFRTDNWKGITTGKTFSYTE